MARNLQTARATELPYGLDRNRGAKSLKAFGNWGIRIRRREFAFAYPRDPTPTPFPSYFEVRWTRFRSRGSHDDVRFKQMQSNEFECFNPGVKIFFHEVFFSFLVKKK